MENCSQALKPNGICSAKLQTCFRPVTPFPFQFLSFVKRMSILSLSYCVLGADTCLGFTSPQMEKNFASDEPYLITHPY